MLKNKGFSLIELILVFTVIGILSSIAIPRISGFIKTSRLAADQATVRTLNNVTPMSRVNLNSHDPFADENKTNTELIEFLFDMGYLNSKVVPQTKDAEFAWLNNDEKWHLLIGTSFHIITFEDGLSINGAMLGSWGGGFGESETYSGESKSIIIPNSLNGDTISYIGRHAFRDVGLVSVVFENDSQVERIHTDAFRGNLLGEISFPETIERIDMRAFQDNNLTEIDLPESLTKIEREAFWGNELETISIGSNVVIGTDSFGENTDQFKEAYEVGGKGTYIFNSENWVKQ